METKTISMIRMIPWMLLLIVIALTVVYREEIGNWLMSELTSGSESQLQQLLR